MSVFLRIWLMLICFAQKCCVILFCICICCQMLFINYNKLQQTILLVICITYDKREDIWFFSPLTAKKNSSVVQRHRLTSNLILPQESHLRGKIYFFCLKTYLGLAYVLLVETNPFPNLSLFYRTMLFEYPSVLSRFCFVLYMYCFDLHIGIYLDISIVRRPETSSVMTSYEYRSKD